MVGLEKAGNPSLPPAVWGPNFNRSCFSNSTNILLRRGRQTIYGYDAEKQSSQRCEVTGWAYALRVIDYSYFLSFVCTKGRMVAGQEAVQRIPG